MINWLVYNTLKKINKPFTFPVRPSPNFFPRGGESRGADEDEDEDDEDDNGTDQAARLTNGPCA